MNNRRFVWFVLALIAMSNDTGAVVLIQALVIMAGFEVLYFGFRWLALIPRRTAEEARERRANLERLFPETEA